MERRCWRRRDEWRGWRRARGVVDCGAPIGCWRIAHAVIRLSDSFRSQEDMAPAVIYESNKSIIKVSRADSPKYPSLPVDLDVLFAAAMGDGDHDADADQNRDPD
jgi:hypothetical protein